MSDLRMFRMGKKVEELVSSRFDLVNEDIQELK